MYVFSVIGCTATACLIHAQNLASDYTLGRNITKDGYHIEIVRGMLTRNLGKLLGDVRDEIVLAFDENIPVTDGTPIFLLIHKFASGNMAYSSPKIRLD